MKEETTKCNGTCTPNSPPQISTCPLHQSFRPIKKGKPTQPNRTGIATASDTVMTPINIAKLILEHFQPAGQILEPARGTGNIFNLMDEPKDWCEITEGRDFLKYNKKVDWIITNPPYSIYDNFLEHCFEISENALIFAADKNISWWDFANESIDHFSPLGFGAAGAGGGIFKSCS